MAISARNFWKKKKTVPFGDCLCGRAASSGQLLVSESCFTDSQHERIFSDMKPHGHYIVPLKSFDNLVGVLFLYMDIHPSWYQHSQEVLLSIGGLITNTIERKQIDEELDAHRNRLEGIVASRTQDLVKSKEQYRKLSNQIQQVREEEKSRIAREVHGQLGQELTVLKIDTVQLGKKLPADQIDLKSKIESMTQIIDETIKSVQHIATELRPRILDAFGICETVSWQAKECQKRNSLQFDLNFPQNPVEIDKGLQTSLFRIFQEAVTNILRHASANLVQVGMTYIKENLIFVIEGNGVGIKKKI
jgi:signal transduction histidine kinase